MAEIAQLKTHIIRYSKTREIYAAYKKSRNKKEFRAEHEAEITQHEAAKKAFDAFPDKFYGKSTLFTFRAGEDTRPTPLDSLKNGRKQSFCLRPFFLRQPSPASPIEIKGVLENLTQEAKEIIQCSNRKISKANALKLSKLDPVQQKEAASQFAAKLINSIDEYHAEPAEPDDAEEKKPKQEILPDAGQTAPPPAAPAKKRFLTFEENEADLKDPNKDCSCTPDIFLSEISAYIRKFQHGIEWYVTPAYSVVFPELTQAQVGYLRELMDSVRATLDKIFDQIEGSTKE